jgi:cytoplasmic iron level regulating protein YaaA (DUF328/UPF0246 family)
MILVISPAKTLDFELPAPLAAHSQADFLDRAAELIDILRRMSPAEIAALMKLSDALAALSVARHAAWTRPFTLENAKQALFAFAGDVYEGLDAKTLTTDGLEWAQAHLRILSGLYALLRPLDLMQPYRLEMGARLANPRGKDLYAFWDGVPTAALNELFAAMSEPVLVNLASVEYFKVLERNALKARIVTPVFEDWKDGRYGIVGFYAKRARGLMCRHAIDNRLDSVEALREFDREGYAFAPEASDADTWVFRRRRN